MAGVGRLQEERDLLFWVLFLGRRVEGEMACGGGFGIVDSVEHRASKRVVENVHDV